MTVWREKKYNVSLVLEGEWLFILPQQTQPHEIKLAVSIFHSLKHIKIMKELNKMCELLVLRSNEVRGLKRQFTPFNCWEI